MTDFIMNDKNYVTVFRLIDKPNQYIITAHNPQPAAIQFRRFRRDEGHGIPDGSIWPVYNLEWVFCEEAPDRYMIEFVRSSAKYRTDEGERVRMQEYGWYIFDAMPSFAEWLLQYKKYCIEENNNRKKSAPADKPKQMHLF